MCTIGRTAVGTAFKAYHRADRAEFPLRDGQKRKDCGSKRGRNPFLTTPVPVKAIQSLVKEWGAEEQYELITQENYEFLRDSYIRYVKLLGGEPESISGKSVGERIAALYHAVNRLIGDETGVNIEQDAGRLRFRLWKWHKWGQCTLYYFPVKFIEELNPRLKRIVVSFMHDLMRGNGMDTILDCNEFDFAIDCLSEPCESSPAEVETWDRLRRSYEEGKIHRLLRQVCCKRYYKHLDCTLDRYEPRNGYEEELTGLMKEGLQFLHPEKPLMSYAYDPYYREDPDFYPISLESQVMIVYDERDPVSEFLENYFNSYYGETYEIVPMETLDLSPDMERTFSMNDDYPKRFFKWADRFIYHIT